jgi:hypothetical protein
VRPVDPTRDPDYAAALLRRAAALPVEAMAVLDALDLHARLESLGPTELIGSVVSGLMVWPDIDLSVSAPHLSLERAWDALHPLLTNPRVLRLNYRNETGDPVDPRLYLVFRYEPAPGTEWKIDISIWTADAPPTFQAELADLRRQLTDEIRLVILWIKDVWYPLASYPEVVGGFEVYDAVLNHGARTPEDFDRYLDERGLPGRA